MPSRARRYIGSARDVVAVELDDALVRLNKAGDHVEDGRLAGAVRAEQADGLAAPHIQADILDDAAGLVGLGEIMDREQALPVEARPFEIGAGLKVPASSSSGAFPAAARPGHPPAGRLNFQQRRRHEARFRQIVRLVRPGFARPQIPKPRLRHAERPRKGLRGGEETR